jgi:S1-C subfamily serine protease
MPSEWYVRTGDNVGGPYTKQQLTALAKKGRVTPTTSVRNGGSGPWRSACDIPGLFPWIDEVRPPSTPPGAQKATASPGAQKSAPKTAPPPQKAGLSRNMLIGIAAGVGAFGVLCVAAVVGLVAWMVYWRSAPEPVPQNVGPVAEYAPQIDDAAAGEPFLPAPELDDVAPPMSELNPFPGDALPAPEAEVEAAAAPAAVVPEIAPAPADAPEEAPAQIVDADALPAAPKIEPKPILPAVPAEKQPIEDREITDVFKRVRLERKAVDAHALLGVFAQSYAFTESQQKRVDDELAEFKTRAAQDLYRLGTDWVPLADVESAEQEADQLITRAAALIEVGSFKECIDFLEGASRTNPNGIRADYVLGLIYSLPLSGIHGPDIAERHFRKVLAREPDHPGALNSLAIAQIKQRDFNAAVVSLSRAAEVSENCQEVSQNLGRFIFLVQSGLVPANSAVVKRFSDVYSRLIADKKAQPFSDRRGWLHSVPVFPTHERDRKAQDTAPAAAPAKLELVPRAFGSGFIIAHEYVMTNRHVVYDDETSLGVADAVGVIDPRDPAGKREMLGTVVAVSDETDLALVKFAGLQGKPLALVDEPIDLASEVLILGFPVTNLLGNTLKATQGVVAGLPDETRVLAGDCYLFDATADHGNSGGPILDKNGCVVAVLTFGLRPMNAQFTGGVTADAVQKFAAANVPDFAPGIPDDGGYADWADMTKAVSPSVLKLKTYYKAGEPALAIAANRAKAGGNLYEDRTCPTCTGMSRLACPQKGCVRGQVTVKYFDTAVRGVAPNTYVIRVEKSRKEQCPNCDGAGSVDCPACREGVDRQLR